MILQTERVNTINKKMKDYYSQNKWIQNAVSIGLIVGILMLVMPFIVASGYTYLCEDDFSFEGGALDAAEQYGQIRGAFHGAHRYYMTAQGTYFANMVWHIVRPYVRWGVPGFHLVMIANMVIFVMSLCLVIKNICKEKNYSLSVILLTFFAIWGISDTFKLQELLFWYTGTVNFTWVLSFSMLTLMFQLKIKDEENKRKQWGMVIISAITALIGSGGALMITAVQCAWLLLVLLLAYDEIKDKKIIIAPFIFAFAGALWNTCAPGNYIRVREIENVEQYSVWNAIIDTWLQVKNYATKIFSNPTFLLILVMVFVITYIVQAKVISGGINHIKLLIVVVGVFAIQYLTAFPVILGYFGRGLSNMRTSATYELIAKIAFIFLAMCLGQWSGENFNLLKKFLPVVIVGMLSFALLNIKEIKMCISDGYAYTLTKELLDGTIRDVYKVREFTLSQLDNAVEGTDVVVWANSIPNNKTMYGMGLMEDPNSFVNASAAGLYRLNSVSVIYE